MSVSNHPPQRKWIGPLIIAAICVLAAFLAWRSIVPPTASLLSSSGQAIASPEFADGAWYWIENSNTPQSRLMRAVGSTVANVASTDQIRSYSVGHGKIAWIAGDGKTWSISVEGVDGSGKAGIWSGDREPTGIYLADDKLYWMEPVPAPVPDSGPMPPLGPTLRVVSAPLAGGAPPTPVGAIMESEGQKVIGIHGGVLYASAGRGDFKDVTTVYALPLNGGPPKRVVAELGNHSTLLMPDGTLYWTSQSREDAQPDKAACVWRLGKDGKPEPIVDWLPFGGRLFATASGVCYIDGGFDAAAWPIGAPRTLPRSLPLPQGYKAIAVGNGEVLLQPAFIGKNAPIYRTALP